VSVAPLFSQSTIVIPLGSSKEATEASDVVLLPPQSVPGFSREDVSLWLRENGSELAGAKLENCRKRGRVFRCPNGHRWAVPIRCDLRICPPCLKRLGRKVWDIRAKDLAEMARGKQGWTWKMLTLTLRVEGDGWTKEGLRERIKKIWKCARKLLKEFFLLSSDAGAVGVTEVGSGGNVHLHVVVWGPYASQDVLSERWLALTGDSKIVDIRQIKGSLEGALRYVGKYLSKVPGYLEVAQFGVYLQALTGHRRIHTFGALLRSPDPELTGSLICEECGLGLQVDSSFYQQWHHPPWDWILQGLDGVGVLGG